MQVVSLHADVVVARSEIWQTNCTLAHRGTGTRSGTDTASDMGECFVIDSPLLPDELEALPAILAQAGWELSGLLCTHGDWDHLLGRLAFADAALGCAETTTARLRAAPREAQRELRDFDAEHYVERRRPLALGQVQALPVPGHLDLGDEELDLIPADGHTPDGMAIWLGWAEVLVCGDYLSPVEIPWLQEQGSREGYLATLGRLAPYVERAAWVVPGHGPPLERDRALTILHEDVAYLQALGHAEVQLPRARRSASQLKIHAENLERVR